MRTESWIMTTLLVLTLSASAAAQEVGLSANVGWTSDYLYRGITQTTSSASAGLDLTVGPLYLGSWAADVGDGSEIDAYGGLGWEVRGVAVTVGATGYFYTGQFDDTYAEGNFGLGYGPFSAALALGQYYTDPETLDYSFLQLTTEVRGAYATVGTFGNDFSGEYLEIGYGFTVAEIDVTVGWVWSDSELSLLPSGKSDETLVLGVSKTFSIR